MEQDLGCKISSDNVDNYFPVNLIKQTFTVQSLVLPQTPAKNCSLVLSLKRL